MTAYRTLAIVPAYPSTLPPREHERCPGCAELFRPDANAPRLLEHRSTGNGCSKPISVASLFPATILSSGSVWAADTASCGCGDATRRDRTGTSAAERVALGGWLGQRRRHCSSGSVANVGELAYALAMAKRTRKITLGAAKAEAYEYNLLGDDYYLLSASAKDVLLHIMRRTEWRQGKASAASGSSRGYAFWLALKSKSRTRR